MNFKFCIMALLPLLAACNKTYSPTEAIFDDVAPNAPISALHRAAAEGEVPLREDYIVSGRITANDNGGNIYGRIVIEDSTGAVELNLGLWNLHALYPVGMEVTVKARGLTAARFDGVLQLGLRIDVWNSYRTEALGSRVVVDRHLFRTGAVADVVPLSVAARQLSPELCGRLVKIEGMVYAGEEPSWGETEYGSQAERVFVDEWGAVLTVATSSYADFASQPIPRGTLSLTGILYGKSAESGMEYVLKLRSDYDIEML